VQEITVLSLVARGIVLAALTVAEFQSVPIAGSQRPRAPLTFARDIAPILFEHCAACHRPGQVAPFSVLEYATVRPYARQIAAAVLRRSMPPWPPEQGYGEFSHERRLRDDQIEAVQRWVQEGALGGDPRDLPPAPTWSEGWQLGKPDLVVTLPEAYTLRADGGDVFRNFVLPVDVASTRYVRGWEFRPGNARIVHHATLFVDPTRSSRRLDANDSGPGYEGMLGVGEGVRAPDGQFLGWTPGRGPSLSPDNLAWRLEPGTDLVMQLHLMPTGRAELIQPSVGLFFSDTPPAPAPAAVRFKLSSRTIDIPAGRKDYQITDSYVLPVDVDVLSVNPHAHYLAKDMKAFATLPDGTVRWLIWIKDWDFNWQDVYQYAKPNPLPRGATITMQYTYDNSADNKRNPHRPPERVVFGPRSTDEMGDLWLQLLPRRSADRAILVRDANRRDAAAAVAEAEQLVRIAPDAEKHNLLAVRYIESGRLDEAKAQLESALRSRPDYANAHSNMGSLLQTQGRLSEAIDHFRQALAIEPRQFEVHFNLGNALNAAERFEEAIDQFQQALAIKPESFESHNNLAVALGSLGRLDEATPHLRRALEINPDYADAHSNLGLALESAGERDEAIRHFRRALEIQPDHAAAQEQLRLLQAR